jgi:hypothetical protein
MTDDVSAPRSRRALLAAAAGGAAALAASAALPLTAMAANDDPVLLGHTDNNATASTGITNSTADSTAFAASAAGTGYGLEGSSSGGAGILGWSISAPTLDPVDAAYTGVWGWSPTAPMTDQVGVGVVGESEDWGVLGMGTVGVYGYGTYGVIGESASTAAGVVALASSPTDVALEVVGKVKFSRSGRSNVSAGRSNRLIYLAGVTTSSKVFAVLHSNRSGRYVRAVIPATGRFRIYLNGTVSSTTSVAWFVVD